MRNGQEIASRSLQVEGDTRALRLVPADVRPPGPNEVRIRVSASSATLSDSIVRRGMSPYLADLATPFTLGYDFVGRVEAIGEAVRSVAVGDLVADLVRFGGNSDVVVRPSETLTTLASDVDPLLVEVMVMTGMTALQMLARQARVAPGDTVLVHGASGAVGLLAVALAPLLGAGRVIGTASAAKLDLVTSQGARAIDRDAPDLEARIERAAEGRIDVVLDSVGGDAVTAAGRLLAPGGRLVTFGLSGLARGGAARTEALVHTVGRAFRTGAEEMERINAGGDGRSAGAYDVSTWRQQHRAWYDEDLAWLLQQVASGALRPVVTARRLDEAVEAHAQIDAGLVRGRLVFDHR